MPVHDWTKVDPGVFHHFHLSWLGAIKAELNRGEISNEYYALAEPFSAKPGLNFANLNGPTIGQLLQEGTREVGGLSVITAPPKVRYHSCPEGYVYASKANAAVIRRHPGHEVIAMIQIVSPGNKSSKIAVTAFAEKAEQVLRAGIHLFLVDLFPPTRHAPDGIHRAIWGDGLEGDFCLPDDKPLTCVSYVAYPRFEVYLEPVAVGDQLPDMPLFLSSENYVSIPLEETYNRAWQSLPAFLQEVLIDDKPPGDGTGTSRRGRR